MAPGDVIRRRQGGYLGPDNSRVICGGGLPVCSRQLGSSQTGCCDGQLACRHKGVQPVAPCQSLLSGLRASIALKYSSHDNAEEQSLRTTEDDTEMRSHRTTEIRSPSCLKSMLQVRRGISGMERILVQGWCTVTQDSLHRAGILSQSMCACAGYMAVSG